ncbi:MAG: DUF3365 domain-containing protein [Anaerolineae bacterium]|jgi:two-component system, NarL family, nitrate/nitrite sensor histidine kinase NarX|nr:DUF3365 domain-containing protein [Anaerolineae bacterium]MBT7075078.1 DUF3365 domain-containing protein [Anaerolineae bacterium]MBT7781976.1 DUF3365 domain-containing protein [Anaerolineae bacterium]
MKEKKITKRIFTSRSSIGMRLTLSIGLVISLTIFILSWSIYRNEKEQHLQQIHSQAEALLSEMTLTREWISSYNGIWTTTPGDYYLFSKDGYYQKSPAMVTKELSNLSNDKRDYSFHITSLILTNPENIPDNFEHDALIQFEDQFEPVAKIDRSGDEPVYRLMFPLEVKASCLECHDSQGYEVGDIRGGLSVLVPISEMDASLAKSRRILTFSALSIVVLVMVALYIMVRKMIISPVSALKDVAVAVGSGDYDARCNLNTGDELEVFGNTLNEMVSNLKISQDRLKERVTQRTQELDTISEVALIISQSGALDDLLNEALQKVIIASGADGGLIQLLEKENTRIASYKNLPADIISCFSNNSQKKIDFSLQKSIQVENINKDTCQELLHGTACAEKECEAIEAKYARIASVLLKSRSRSLGAMILFSEKENSFSPEIMQLLESIGNQLGVAIENAKYHQHIEEIAVLEERARISRELHDSLAQTLGWLSIKTELLEEDLKLGKIQEGNTEMKNIRKVVRDACYDVRESIDGLRTRPTGDLNLTAASWIAEFRQRSGLETDFQVSKEKMALSPRVETELLRILQEALTNIRKHANAKSVSINLREKGDYVELIINDDGSGFDYNLDLDKKHFGLRIMRERAENLGGSLHVESELEKGTRVTATLPIYPSISK